MVLRGWEGLDLEGLDGEEEERERVAREGGSVESLVGVERRHRCRGEDVPLDLLLTGMVAEGGW